MIFQSLQEFKSHAVFLHIQLSYIGNDLAIILYILNMFMLRSYMDFVQNINGAKNLSQQFVSNVECQRKFKLFKTHICQAKSRVKPTVKYKSLCCTIPFHAFTCQIVICN